MSLLGRREVLTGKAKFGIFGDGKEVPQVALAKFFKPGDWRSGYYRDQTWMLALGIATPERFFAQLYADPDISHDPWSAGRQMNAHFNTKNTDSDGNWLPLANQYNVAADMAPTAAQIPRSLGLAAASKHFREISQLKDLDNLSNNGNEVCFCSIGDASTSEGHFWETMNAAAVLQVPLAVFVWDDGYGISVPKEMQTTKGSISEALRGLEKGEHDANGIRIYTAKAWDYAGMCEIFEEGIERIRNEHIPALFHIEEVTQPQGHSTSGSHERYKSEERLQWEKEWDCIAKMKQWILANDLSTEDEIEALELNAKQQVLDGKNAAWKAYIQPIKAQADEAMAVLQAGLPKVGEDANNDIAIAINELRTNREPLRRDVLKALSIGKTFTPAGTKEHNAIAELLKRLRTENELLYNSHLYNEGIKQVGNIAVEPAEYQDDAAVINGYEVLNRFFDQLFESNPLVIAFGEDVGNIGDVNQGFAGLQARHGIERIFDTGIRETTIVGHAIGLALRGLRPIAEIQYLDYVLYGLQQLSDEVATMSYRTVGSLKCPVIIRTRGHRLEGIWHSGSPMQMLLGSIRGMHLCVPRNMTKAAGMYNTLLQSNDPGIVIEALNGYRLKEKLPVNLLRYKEPLGVVEVIREGADITIVSYGSMLRIIMQAAERLAKLGVEAEVIDVQTLLPFDTAHDILKSLQKTNRILFVDEDVPGGATAFMFRHVMEEQGGYRWLDGSPRTLTGKAHRPAYGSDGDYFSKPNVEDVAELVLQMVAE